MERVRQEEETSETMEQEDSAVLRRKPDRDPSSRKNKIELGRSRSATELPQRAMDRAEEMEWGNKEGVYKVRQGKHQEEIQRIRHVANEVMEVNKERQAVLILNRGQTIDKYNKDATTDLQDVRGATRNGFRNEKERYATEQIESHRYHAMQMEGIERETQAQQRLRKDAQKE